jgi:predicted nucleotidyltransferase
MATENATQLRIPRASDPALAEIIRRLAEVYRPERICLFGSVARGAAGPNSDYDLMILLPNNAPDRLRTEDAGYSALRGTGAAADIIVWTRADFDKQLHLNASLPSTVLREGALVYAA